jgi:oligoendopeptidase F
MKSHVNSAVSTSAGRADEPALGPLPEWSLTDLYPAMDSPQFAEDLVRAEHDARTFAEDYRGKLATLAAQDLADPKSHLLIDAVRRYEAFDELTGKLSSYASLVYSGDTSDPVRVKFYSDTQEKLNAAWTGLLFFQLELNRLDDDVIAKLTARQPLDHYRPWLDDIRKDKPYELADDIERLFHEKSVTSRAAFNRLFDETITSLRFKIGGEELALEPTLNLMQDTKEEVRKEAAGAIAETLSQNLRTFAFITNVLAKDKEISDRWHGFKDVADSRHLANRVEREVVDALAAAVQAAYPRLSHRYYKLKARWFGKEALDFWDRNAPLPRVPQRNYSWNDARDTVLGAYADFSPRMAGIAEQFFARNWIDAPVRPGKAPGAFAHPTVPSVHPYVLLNYQGKPRDVMTLAHELGHGVHQVLAAPNGALMASTPLTLAETASVFGEMLTFRALLAKATSVTERRAMLAAKVEDMINTVVRQTAFYLFERKVHIERRAGELTREKICELWMSVQGESLGPAIRLGPGYETFWAYIPHFIHSPFYVYAYAFGDCLVNSLYGVYQRASEGFAERYLAMLAAGGSKHYSELLAPFGLDARDPAFWQIGLGMVEELIGELESLEGKA